MHSINLSIDPDKFEGSFRRIAEELMNNFNLFCGVRIFRIYRLNFIIRIPIIMITILMAISNKRLPANGISMDQAWTSPVGMKKLMAEF